MADSSEYSFAFTAEQMNDIIAKVFDGTLDVENLPEDLVNAIYKTLQKAVKTGFGSIEFGAVDTRLLKKLQENVYMFSTAKTFQEIAEMQFNLVDEKGTLLPFNEFKDKATEIFNRYNGVTDAEVNPGWLEAEYNTAIAQAQNAKKWNEIEKQKEVLPYLMYSTSGSPCEDCAPLEGITLPVDDPFWDDYMPENHFNCACVVEQVTEETDGFSLTSDDDIDEAIDKANIDDNFRFNPGKIGEVFKSTGDNKHPYFEGFSSGDIKLVSDRKPFNIKNKYMAKIGIVDVVTKMFESEAQTHIYHLQVNIQPGSNAVHQALNEFYTSIPELRDRLIETYQGKYGIITGYEGIPLRDLENNNVPKEYLKGVVRVIEEYRDSLVDGYLQAILDEVVELFYKTLYKLENLM